MAADVDGTARHSAAPHRNSPNTRVSAGAPTHVFKRQSNIAKMRAVPPRAASAITSAMRGSRTRVNAGASSLTRDAEKQDPSRRRAIDDARAAFVGLDADETEAQGAANKKSRRQRPRRGQRDTQNEPTFKKDRASQNPSNS